MSTKNPWFRLYSRIMTDPKVEYLSFEDQRHFVWLLCMKNEGFLDEDLSSDMRERMVSRKLGIHGEAFENAKQRLLEVGLIDKKWQPISWDELQFKSDSSKERVRKYRERKKNSDMKRDCNVTVTVQEKEEEKDTEEEKEKESISPSGDTSPNGNCPHAEILDIYHECLPELPRVLEWTTHRQKLLRARWRENPERQNLEWWRAYFNSVAASDFLMGRTSNSFTCDLEWLVRPINMPKVIEGRYANRSNDWTTGVRAL